MLSSGKQSRVPAQRLDAIGTSGGNGVSAAQAQSAEITNPVRNIAFRMGVILVFIRFSIIHQLIAYLLHINLYLLYLFGIPTLLGVVLAGGVRRTMRGRPAILWTIFVVWLVVGVPFSSWKGGSAASLNAYVRTDFPMLFVIAGLTLTWRECCTMMRAIAVSTGIIMMAAKVFQDETGTFGDRLAINFGTISNSNDYACHLVLVLPFVIWVGLSSKSKVIQLGAFGAVAFGVLLVLKTASRGALLAMVAGGVFWLLRGTMRQRIALLAAGPIAVVGLIAFVPQSSLIRLVSFSSGDSGASREALDSSAMRKYLLMQSIVYTIEHPVFGVGMSQFSAFEGGHNVIVGTHGYWHEAHNTYTQVSSECGVPALALYLGAIFSTFLMMNRVYRQACKRTDCEDIRNTAFCIMLGLTTYCTAITFVNFGYFFYLPVMSSLVIAVAGAAQAEFASRSLPPVAQQPSWTPRRKPVAVAGR
jgi:hypothetical protein